MDPGVTAALATGVSPYVVVLWPAAAGGERWLAIGVIWMMAAAGSIGLASSTRLLRLMTALKLLLFVAVVVVAFTTGAGNWSNFQPFVDRHGTPGPLAETLAIGLVSVFFAFGGFWEASRVTGEVKEPKRTMPAALAVGVTCVTVVYMLTTLAFIYLVPIEAVTSATEFAQRAGTAMLGETGPRTLALVVVVSVLASILALLIMAPRLYVAMSRDGIFPPAVAAVNSRTGAPARATILLAGIATLFVAIGTFEQIVAFFMCTTLTFIALAAAALLVVPRETASDALLGFLGRVAPVLFILLVTGVVILIALNRPVQALAGAAIVLLGAPAYRVFGRATDGGA